jgi:hypothetical protein
MIKPFEASAIKIARAKRHLQDLTSEIDAFFKRGAVRVVFEHAEEFNSVGHMAAFTYREQEAVPVAWSGIIGDVNHNLRSSLDLVVSDIHRIAGGNPKDAQYVHYPFCKEKSGLPDIIRSRAFS